MLAYLFWHRPREGAPVEDYERALETFHRSLAHRPPAGMTALASYRLAELPWWAPESPEGPTARPGPAREGTTPAPAYEDWYLVADYASLGVLNEAAAGRGHRTRHDEIAALAGPGAGGVYALLEGDPDVASLAGPAWPCGSTMQPQAPAARAHSSAVSGRRSWWATAWIGATASLWRRQLVLGPAPELCRSGRSRRRARARVACRADGAHACSSASHCGVSEHPRRFARLGNLVATGVRVEFTTGKRRASSRRRAPGHPQQRRRSFDRKETRSPDDDQPHHRAAVIRDSRAAQAARRALRLRSLEGAPGGARSISPGRARP